MRRPLVDAAAYLLTYRCLCTFRPQIGAVHSTETMEPIFRLLASDGEPYRLEDDAFLKLQAWLSVRRRISLTEIQRDRAAANQRNKQVEQLRELLEYNKLVRNAQAGINENLPTGDAAPTSEASTVSVVPRPGEPERPLLRFVPGGFHYGSHFVELKGKPYLLFKKAAESRNGVVTSRDAANTIWKDSNATPNAINKAAGKVRTSLRAVLPAGDDTDPFPPVDRGNELAWKINVPFRNE